MITPVLSLGNDNGNERAKLPVIGMSSAQINGNYTITIGVDIPFAGKELFIANDSASNLTITVTCDGGILQYTVLGVEQFDERLPLFSQVVVTATSVWRWKVRGNVS